MKKRSIRKFRIFHLVVAVILGAGCNTGKPFHEVKADNPQFRPDTAFVGFEDLTSQKVKALKEKYQLDTIFHGETDEFKRILLLRHWIHNHIKIDNYGPYAYDGTVESILDAALKGNGFHCGHYTAVQNAILNSYGYATRCIIADVGVQVDYIIGGGHHAINEVWSNSFKKWFVSDAKYDYHFEKNGIPLSALEIRDEYFKNKGADITDNIPREKIPELKTLTMEQFSSVYTWLSWGKYNNRYTNWPNTKTDSMNVFEDDYSRNHTWLWDGKPHWAYKTGFMNWVKDRNAIEWTPNTITSKVQIKEEKARIELNSITPNLETYQLKEQENGEWKDVSSIVELDLTHDRNELTFRTKNLASVTGPEHKVIIER